MQTAAKMFVLLLIIADAAACTPKATVEQSITKALSEHEHASVRLIEITQEVQDGHRVACGLYQRANDTPKDLAHPFGWIDGQLAMKWGPAWNAATLCLIHHYNAPLP
jgi:hypothetical protein